uniref:Uncharacterized protein n=1 Tax=Rhizophagus irregularis (strain DAOM 181602 / DAOM 197198 / MUCL 43194) TaxID=747089 RepID=U9V6Z1_RHIID
MASRLTSRLSIKFVSHVADTVEQVQATNNAPIQMNVIQNNFVNRNCLRGRDYDLQVDEKSYRQDEELTTAKINEITFTLHERNCGRILNRRIVYKIGKTLGVDFTNEINENDIDDKKEIDEDLLDVVHNILGLYIEAFEAPYNWDVRSQGTSKFLVLLVIKLSIVVLVYNTSKGILYS